MDDFLRKRSSIFIAVPAYQPREWPRVALALVNVFLATTQRVPSTKALGSRSLSSGSLSRVPRPRPALWRTTGVSSSKISLGEAYMKTQFLSLRHKKNCSVCSRRMDQPLPPVHLSSRGLETNLGDRPVYRTCCCWTRFRGTISQVLRLPVPWWAYIRRK